MKEITFILLVCGVIAHGFQQYDILATVKKILPSKVIENIPSKLSEQINRLDSVRNGLTTEYKFPQEYKSTIYKDYAQKTILVNVFPTVETETYSPSFFSPGFQSLETSTTLLYQMLNSTVEYQTTPMLNSTYLYPTTVARQSIGHVVPEFQHETLVYSTAFNISAATSTTLVNYTKVEEVNNALPLV